jgi:outer membrane protein TolC
VALALENGVIGNRFINGTTEDELTISFANGSFSTPQTSVRVLALDPAILASDIDNSLSKFDVHWNSQMSWINTDRPVASPLETLIAGPLPAIQAQTALFTTSLIKPLPTGGVAGITFSTEYDTTNVTTRLNPAYRPDLMFSFEQPLLQGFGVEINQLRSAHPGSILTPFPTGSRVDGILLTRVRFDAGRANFERIVSNMLGNVEVAYWNLYGAYGSLYAQESALRQSFQAYKINRDRFQANRTNIQDFYQSRAQYELFRGRRLTALGIVLEDEHQLRGLIGLPVEDGTRLIPADAPTIAPFQPDWCTAANEAMALRPELVLARQELKLRQLELINEKNLLLPDLRFFSEYDIQGIGTRLDGGPDPTNALHSLATDKFTDWTLGLRLDVPLGFRQAHAEVRRARLLLARSYGVLQDQENRVQRYLAQEYRLIFESYEEIKVHRASRQARTIELNGRFQDFALGLGSLDRLLEAQRFWSEALRAEYEAIRDYNNALARFEYAKGTLLDRDNVIIAEGPLPGCAQVRAVEHERQRTEALVLRERAKPIKYAHLQAGPQTLDGAPDLPPDGALSLPALLENQGPPPQDLESLSRKATDSVPSAESSAPAGTPSPANLPEKAPSASPPATTPSVPQESSVPGSPSQAVVVPTEPPQSATTSLPAEVVMPKIIQTSAPSPTLPSSFNAWMQATGQTLDSPPGPGGAGWHPAAKPLPKIIQGNPASQVGDGAFRMVPTATETQPPSPTGSTDPTGDLPPAAQPNPYNLPAPVQAPASLSAPGADPNNAAGGAPSGSATNDSAKTSRLSDRKDRPKPVVQIGG